MKKTALMIIEALMGPLCGAMAQPEPMLPPMPADREVRIGRLDNGLTYYIRYNNWPEHRAEFYIAERVGSLQEEEEQRGLAHFLEHISFNGTEHFPGDSMLRWCETVGIKYGTDINAYTSIDETVYNISNVPTERKAVVDTCLLILHDWAGALLLDEEEIEKERGVIHEEWRLRTSSQMRMLERNLEALYPGSKYGRRMPIGLMSVVDSFAPQVLRDYYEKWYRPDNQAIIVVGDVDVDYVESSIVRLFGDDVMPEGAAPVERVEVPDNDEPIVVSDKDKEHRVNYAAIMIKHDVLPDSMKESVAYVIQEYVKGVVTGMLNDRLTEIALADDCPLLGGETSYGEYLLSKTKDAFEIYAVPKEGQTVEQALAAAYREALRAARYGFTDTEYGRYKAEYLSKLEKTYSNKDKRYNRQFVEQCKRHFLDHEPMPSIDEYYQIMKQMVPMIPIDAINAMARLYVPENDSNMVVLNFNVEKDGAEYPTPASLLAAIDAVREEELEAYVDNVRDEPLITRLPQRGSIVAETTNDTLGYRVVTLSNGATVVMKHTDYKKDQVTLTAKGFGGEGLYGADDYVNLAVFGDAIEASGLGNFSNTELYKALAGKMAGASMAMGETRVRVNGTSTPGDMETMLQLVYLYFTNINKDEESFGNMMKTYETSLKNRALEPTAAFADTLSVMTESHNPRYKPLTVDDLDKVDYDRILEIARQSTANAAAFTFTIVGNYDELSIDTLIERYIASLPSETEIVRAQRVSTPFKGVVANNFKRKMETPKANAVMMWRDYECPYTLDNMVRADMAGQILSMIYLKKIREDASAAYSCGAVGRVSRTDDDVTASIMVYCPVKPEKCDTAFAIIYDEMETMTATVDADKLDKVKEYLLKAYDDKVKTNNYWTGAIDTYREYGVDIYTDYKATVEAQTPQSVAAFVRQMVEAGNTLQVVMLPEEE